MPEFFLELFSEEMPAEVQSTAASRLQDVIADTFAGLLYTPKPEVFYGPRRLAVFAEVASEKAGGVNEVRGPRTGAPDAALSGFLAKHVADKRDLVIEGDFYWLRNAYLPVSVQELIINDLPRKLSDMSWPKSMRWIAGNSFSWVRPLRRIVCLLDGAVVPLRLGGLTASDETEGHRIHARGPFRVSSMSDWVEGLREHYVIVRHQERSTKIAEQVAAYLNPKGLSLVQDANLVREVVGLVEWPVTLLGKIDEQFMNLPTEVRELSMKVNQKYFALRDAYGKPAPCFAFVANLVALDGGDAVIAGNERVLRARLSDAQHFWRLDLTTPLDELLPALEDITFHAKIGTQRDRAERIAVLARKIAESLGVGQAAADQAECAGRLCKADLVTKMVGEFPDLQGVMGGYYAEKNPRDWDGKKVGEAIKTHYQPKGPADTVPRSIDRISESVALADKIDTLKQFFRIGEKPSGSGDPYALRRAALGVIRIILENDLRLPLKNFLNGDETLFNFIIERLRVKLRGEGRRFDVLNAVLEAGDDDDLSRLMQRVNAVTGFLLTPDGADLVMAYRRAANILKIEDAKDGPHHADAVVGPLSQREEEEFRDMLAYAQLQTVEDFRDGNYAIAMAALSKLKITIDVFFDKVTVNDNVPELRRNRLKLLARFRDTVHQIADFSKLEG